LLFQNGDPEQPLIVGRILDSVRMSKPLEVIRDGEVTRLVVVPNLTDSLTASRRSPAPS